MTQYELQHTVAAILFEIGIPILLILVYYLKPTLRKRIIVLFGSLTPLLLLFFIVTISYLTANDKNVSWNLNWAFHAMWVMCFISYVIMLLIGILLAFFNQPNSFLKRYLIGFSVSSLLLAKMVLRI